MLVITIEVLTVSHVEDLSSRGTSGQIRLSRSPEKSSSEGVPPVVEIPGSLRAPSMPSVGSSVPLRGSAAQHSYG